MSGIGDRLREKIVQIAAVMDSSGLVRLYALSDDGRLWVQEAGSYAQHSAPWRELEPPLVPATDY